MSYDELYHYGTPRHSGRYPWGSGENPYQHESSFLKTVNDLKNSGFNDTEIAKYLGMSTGEYRKRKSLEKEQKRAADLAEIIRLKEKGWSNVAIADRIGENEQYVRYLYNPVVQDRLKITSNTADVIKQRVDQVQYLDIGEGSANMLGVPKTRMDTAIKKLEDEGYNIYYIKVEQAGMPGKYTSVKVLAKPGVEWKEVNQNRDKIGLMGDYYSEDGGRTFLGIEPPTSLDSSRLMIRYNEEGGLAKDGVIELRRGVEDLSLGNSNYAQVRIAVDGTHYLKGMAVYGDDMPDGVDVIFNTNKHVGTKVMGEKGETAVLKSMKDDPDNPFGSTIKTKDGVVVGQKHYIGSDGQDHLSPINIVREEGDWNTWSKTLSSQFLSKQPIELIRQQLDLTYSKAENDYKKILALTNPEVKKKLLGEFADECDSSAVHLKAAALPRQSSKVILPLTDIPDDQVYAPSYRNGEVVALVRYPHGGTFEMPVLTVNNKIESGKRILGNALDAIGIGSKAASQLSGADFDGDTVIVIPIAGQKIKASSPLKGLANFDPKESYPYYDGMKIMSDTQNQMGRISNLITDMTAKGANESELVRAVRHSMVVIDAEKHKLNYKQSYIDNGIAELKEKYQYNPETGKSGGASTLFSRASAEVRGILERKEDIDPATGKKIYTPTNKTHKVYDRDKEGKIISVKEVPNKITSTQMYETDDAFTLSSGTAKEREYAIYANKLKTLANSARKEKVNTPSVNYSPTARETYKNEVNSLDAKLNVALKNKPLERKAQLLASVIIKAKKDENPSMDSDDLKKIKTQALNEARARTGASKKNSQITITDEEWNAIQSGAISNSKLRQILENTDESRVKELATPREFKSPTSSDIARIRSLASRGYTLSEIADDIGFSTSTVSEYVKASGNE